MEIRRELEASCLSQLFPPDSCCLMSMPLPHRHQAQSIITKMEGTKEFGAEAFCPYLWWAAPCAPQEEAGMTERFIYKEFQVQSTQQCHCVYGSIVLPVFAFTLFLCGASFVHTRWEDHWKTWLGVEQL